MGDTYRYPVFFERHSLGREQMKKVEMYFRIRRRSGGGDCGPLRRVNDTTYSVDFKHEKDQQAVLQRSEHVVELADGPLVFTVRSSLDPHASSPCTAYTASQDFTAAVQSPQSIPASTPPSSGEEYELQLDFYLIRYLKECPKAGKELEEKLASVACSAQLYPEEERVLVRTVAQPGAVDEVTMWKAEVKKLFDGYLCHYEFDPHRVKALLQSCSSHQTTDEVKVYSEIGMAVVVGEHSQVKARLMDVKDKSDLFKKDTCIHQLGKAKLRLLWKEIEQNLGRDFPGVKITQGEAGQLVLEGPAKKLVKAGDWISGKEKLVFEKTVCDMSPHVLAFLKKAYGGPGELSDFLQVGDKVEVELKDTELRFFTLSTDNFDETEKALQGVIKEVIINVPNSSAVPCELREKLKSMTNNMNQGQYRAQVVFGSNNTVYLVGHSKEVEELCETVSKFVLDHTDLQSIVHLPSPKLAQELPEFLQLHGFECSGVTLHLFPSSSEPMVVLEGPCSKVIEVRKRLILFLDSLVQDRVIIDLPEAARYFKSPCGREDILGIGNSQRCVVHLEEQPQTARQNLAPDAKLSKGCKIVSSYSLCDGLQVQVCQGDITELEADALVNAANEDLDHCGGVAAALSKAGGPEVQSESNALVKQTGKIPTGDVVVTTGGNLKCKKLLHAVGPIHGKVGSSERILLGKVVHSALNLAEMMEFKSIAMPCISSGVFGVPVDVCSEAIVTAVKGFGTHGGRSLSRIILIDNRGEVVRAMQWSCDRLLQNITTGNIAPSELSFSMDAAAQDTARGATAGAPGNGVHVEIIQGTIETQQVDALVSPMVGHEPLSTRVGNTLFNMVGRQLTAGFRKAAREETLPGDTVLVDGLTGLPANAVFFPNLSPWDDDFNGTAVQVLRQGIATMLTLCENRGFGSVALPVVGAGIALRFPDSVVARVLLQEVHEFERSRASRTPFLFRTVIHPSDKETSEVFKSVQEAFQLEGFTKEIDQPGQHEYRYYMKAKNWDLVPWHPFFYSFVFW